jgi:hypothetical protein
MKNLTNYLLARARERSTWLGLISLATALGLVLSPAQQDAVIASGMAAAGLIGTFTRDKTP